MATTTQPQRTPWWREPEDPNGPPSGVRTATTLLFVLIGLSLAWTAFMVVGAISSAAETGSKPGLIEAVIGAMLAVNLLYLYLTRRVRQGSRRAWITLLVVLSLQVIVLLSAAVAEGSFEGVVILLAAPVIALVLLTVPAESRRYFLRRRAAAG